MAAGLEKKISGYDKRPKGKGWARRLGEAAAGVCGGKNEKEETGGVGVGVGRLILTQ